MLYLVLEPKLIFYLSALPSFFLLHFSFCFIFFLQNSTKKSLPHQIFKLDFVERQSIKREKKLAHNLNFR